MRSKLFVPGSRPELFAKAYAGEADAVSFDLEDSVPAERKAGAREAVAGFLREQAGVVARKCTVVRANPPGSAEFVHDLRALLGAGVDLLNLPRIESPEQVVEAVALIERIEAELGLPAGPRLLLNIETPRGLLAAAAIAAAHPRVAGLQLGLGDLFEPYGIARDEPGHVRAAMYTVAMAAAAAGVYACDSAHPDYTSEAAFEREARMSQRLGFVGKSCIHPRQVAWANRIYMPDAGELEWARRVKAAAREAAARGQAAFSVDGRMVDPPYLRRAERLLAMAGEA